MFVVHSCRVSKGVLQLTPLSKLRKDQCVLFSLIAFMGLQGFVLILRLDPAVRACEAIPQAQ